VNFRLLLAFWKTADFGLVLATFLTYCRLVTLWPVTVLVRLKGVKHTKTKKCLFFQMIYASKG